MTGLRALDEIGWSGVELLPAETMLDRDLPTLEDVIQVGEVDVLDAITYARAGDELDPGVEQLQERFSFALVRIPVNVRAGERIEVRFLEVECILGGAATCWSLTPERVDHEIRAKASAKVSANLRLVTAEATDERESVVYQPSIVAYGIGRQDPAWEFRRVKGQELGGIQLLHLVARFPPTATGDGAVRIRADIVKDGRLFNTVAVGRDESRQVQQFRLGEAP